MTIEIKVGHIIGVSVYTVYCMIVGMMISPLFTPSDTIIGSYPGIFAILKGMAAAAAIPPIIGIIGYSGAYIIKWLVDHKIIKFV